MHNAKLSACALALATSLACLPRPAQAHPHVWVTVKAEIVFGTDGRVSAVRHAWTFDEAYSAFAVQGLDTNKDGKLSREELAELAKVNVDSLHEFDFFTFARANGAKQDFNQPTEYELTFDNAQLTLSFTLPLKSPARQRTFAVEVYDPTWFVSFGFAEGDDAIKVVGAPQGCARTVTRPRPLDPAIQQRLSEDSFSALTGVNVSASFVNRILVACP